jgi:hypothetical protein
MVICAMVLAVYGLSEALAPQRVTLKGNDAWNSQHLVETALWPRWVFCGQGFGRDESRGHELGGAGVFA